MSATALTLELLAPRTGVNAVEDGRPTATTTREFVNVLGRSAPDARVSVGGEPAAVFATGVFVRDRVPLALGINRIALVAEREGQRAALVLEIERVAPPPGFEWPADRLWVDGGSLEPAEPRQLSPGETLELNVRATPGQRVEARLPGRAAWAPLAESPVAVGRYRGSLNWPAATIDDVTPAAVAFRVSALSLPTRGPRARWAKPIVALSPGLVGLWAADPRRLVRVLDNASATGPSFPVALLHGNHEVRLGGPNIAEAWPGTLLRVVAREGGRLRVQLAPGQEAWIDERATEPAPAGSRLPQPVFTSLSVDAAGERDGSEGDVVSLPTGATPLPSLVRAAPQPDASGPRDGLVLDLWGPHYAQTWITHRAGRRLVDEVFVRPAGPQHIRVHVALKPGQRLWGWKLERGAGGLRLVVRGAPGLAAAPASPLAGLKVAVEAGHGSADNLGAVGATGVPEKDINRWTADVLMQELRAAGAQTVDIREGDTNPPLAERARRVVASGAHLFVSLHANATDTAQGYLRVSGVSHYYKHETGRPFAAALQRRLLADTGLTDFGLVGNFNYAPMRLATWCPGVLVEQAFMSHPGDEAKMLDPAFRAALVRAIRQALELVLRGAA
jgi:N-acetylmuramoyl-L-alanine amidase